MLERSALSRDCGTAQLTVNDNSELNALVRDEQSGNASETVRLVTLDDCLQRYGWKKIDFLKIDAEGEEANIIEGGRRFFADLSPLILYEVKAGEAVHLELVHKFAALGFDSYRLVPGLDLLVPFDAAVAPGWFLAQSVLLQERPGGTAGRQGPASRFCFYRVLQGRQSIQ